MRLGLPAACSLHPNRRPLFLGAQVPNVVFGDGADSHVCTLCMICRAAPAAAEVPFLWVRIYI